MEGFGLPPVEAMLAGAPVVASNVPSTGSAAYQVDPNDTDSIAEGLLVVATDETVRNRLQTAGRSHAARAQLVLHRPAPRGSLGGGPLRWVRWRQRPATGWS